MSLTVSSSDGICLSNNIDSSLFIGGGSGVGGNKNSKKKKQENINKNKKRALKWGEKVDEPHLYDFCLCFRQGK